MKKNIKYVWCPQYNCFTFEGGFEDVAICRTRAKARQILKDHKKEIMGKWRKRNWCEVWRIRKREIV